LALIPRPRRANVPQIPFRMWTNDDAEVIAFPEPEDENEELPADSEGGRYWVRTSDPCVVRAARANSTTSANAYLRSSEALCA
jgi:hypothetical protein